MLAAARRFVRCPALAAAAIAGISARLVAQTSDVVLDRWTTDNGLPQNTVTAMAETPDGYLWLATFGGLARFDGLRFEVFSSRQYPGIGSDRAEALAVDSTGALWIGADHGLVRYAGGTFRTFTTEDGLPDNTVHALLADSRGNLWVPTQHGLSRYTNGQFTNFGIEHGLPSLVVYGALEDPQRRVWVVTSLGTAQYDPGTNRFVAGRAILPASDLRGPILRDRDGGVWFEQRGGVARRQAGVLARYPMPVPPIGYGFGLAEGRGGEFWVMSLGTLWRLQLGDRGPSVETVSLPGGMQVRVRAFHVDREGTRWAGTEADGLLRLRPRLFHMISERDGLSTPHPTAILGDGTGRVWVGSNCGPLNVIEAGQLRVFRTGTGETVSCVMSLARALDGALWIGTWGGGALRWDGRTLRRFTAREGLADEAVLAIHADPDGTVWLGTFAGGVFRLQDGKFTTVDTRAGLPRAEVKVIYRDRQGALWIGTTGGLARVQEGGLTLFRRRDGLPHDHVRSAYEDADGTLWFGTYGGGLARFRDNAFTTISMVNGLSDDFVSAILEDNDGNLWMSGNRGVFRVARTTLNDFAAGRSRSVHSVLFGKADGLDPVETNGGFSPAGWKGPDGRLWFPTIKGLAVVDPRVAAINPIAPAVVIERVVADGVVHRPGEALEFLPGTRAVEITYTGISSPSPESVRFRYRLEGVDRGWVEAGARRTAYYSGLPPGRYAFQVAAANRDGVWSLASAPLSFALLPPFWMTWWFRLLAVLAGAAGIGGVVRARFDRLRKAHAAQRAFSQLLIEAQEQERKRLAGELHDGIGQELLVAKNHVTLALAQADVPAPVRERLEQLGGIVSDSLRGAREMAHNLRPYQLDYLGLAAAIRAAVTKAVEGTGIRLVLEVDELDGAFEPDAQVGVFRIVQEGLNNVLKHAECSEARIAVHTEAGQVLIEIRDNGRGVTDVSRARKGFGLSGIGQRVALLDGDYSIESVPGRGTVLRLRIPVRGPR